MPKHYHMKADSAQHIQVPLRLRVKWKAYWHPHPKAKWMLQVMPNLGDFTDSRALVVGIRGFGVFMLVKTAFPDVLARALAELCGERFGPRHFRV